MLNEVLHSNIRECSQKDHDVTPLSEGVLVLCNRETESTYA
jgi:hypothetical protein